MKEIANRFEGVPGVTGTQLTDDSVRVQVSALTAGIRVALKDVRDDGYSVEGLDDCALIGGGTFRVFKDD